MESNFRRALSMHEGSLSVFLYSPISLVLLLLALLAIVVPLLKNKKKQEFVG